jgi:hypothetical protein
MTMGALFDPRPDGAGAWRLRGDPHVWRAMQERLSTIPVPETAAQVTELLHATFSDVVGVDLATTSEESVYRPEFAHGGMSSGYVALYFWRSDLIPMLEARAAATRER